jgi:hypothetical protein
LAIAMTEWLSNIDREYLSSFIPGGGAAVKFVVGDPATLLATKARLAQISHERAFEYVEIDAAQTRVHMIQDVFFEIARRIDWHARAQHLVEDLFSRHHYVWPRPGKLATFVDVAAANRVDDAILRRDLNQWLTAEISARPSLASNFRHAAVQLCLGRMENGAGQNVRGDDPLVQWLTGELKQISAVFKSGISGKITRYNARSMLGSLCNWLRLTGAGGLSVVLDIRQLARDIPAGGDARRYSPSSVMDAYEVLRQIIDDAERFEGLFLVVLADDLLLDVIRNPRRAVQNYGALHMRIVSDVESTARPNPLAPLVELSAAAVQGGGR